MIKRLFFLIISLTITVSCRGILWEGDSADTLTLSINNPFYIPTSSDLSRVLALQGNYLYIELALIEDQTAYNADSGKAVSGSGEWISTDWGGHAIVSFDPSDMAEIIEATFVDVPREQDLIARVLYDVDETTVQNHLANNTEPLCQTYDSTDGDLWIVIPVDDLASNVISLTIRPLSLITLQDLNWIEGGEMGGMVFYDNYLSFPITKPEIGNSAFTAIDPDISTIYARDLAYFTKFNYSGDPYTGSLITLNDETGLMIENTSSVLNIDITQVTSDYSDPGYFMNSSIMSEPTSALTWGIAFGVLYDNNFYAYGTSELGFEWRIPTGFEPGELEFKLIHIATTGLTEDQLDTIVEIKSYPDSLGYSWLDYFSSYDNAYYYSDTSFVSGPSSDSWSIILARVLGSSDEFIFGKYHHP